MRTKRARGDEGVSLVMVALCMVALIGMAALVVDVGALVQERRTLQNGADAAALAVALDCAKGNCGAASATAGTYANANADDGLSAVELLCGSGPGLSPCATPPAGVSGSYVMVGTSTRSTGGSGIVRFVFGQVLGAGAGRTVHRSAVATWGALGTATTLPLTFSACEFDSLVGNVANLPVGPVYVYFHGTGGVGQPTCTTTVNNSDEPIAGGFGYLDTSSGCAVTITSGNWVSDKPGNALPNGCDPVSLRNAEVVMPIFDGTNGLTGANGKYHIGGFALFLVQGYKFSGAGQSWGITGGKCPQGNGANAVCLKGTFTKYASNIGDLTTGGTNYGTAVVKLVA